VQVVGRVQAARDVVTLWLAVPSTLQAPAPYKPGQFVTLALPTDRGSLYRSYSLCGDGSADRPWEITVKRQRAGLVSTYIYDRVVPGMVLYVSDPVGAFILPEPLRPATPLVFVALGSGITPIYGMLRALARLAPERRPRVQLHYAYSSPVDAIYGRELGELDPQQRWLTQWHYISSTGSRLTVEHVLSLSGGGATAAEWYICGSAEFKRPLEAALARRGVAAAQIHAEMFSSPRTPALSPANTAATALTASSTRSSGVRSVAAQIRLADEDRVLAARPGETLLETLERNGYHPDFSCRAGACGACRLRLLAGRVSRAGDALSARERAQGYVLSCIAQPMGDVTLASAGPAKVTVATGAAAGAPRLPAARRVTRRVLRWSLAAAAVALFVQTWTVTSQSQAAASGSDGSQPSNSSPCSTNDDSGAVCAAPTPTPSGPSNIITGPTYPTPTPSTHSHSGSSR
jgi:ferredoxin-NADP reductase